MSNLPFTNFRFEVSITVDGGGAEETQGRPLCNCEFSECSGLEATTGVTSIRSGGDNRKQIHLSGPVTYGQLQLKRGMTSSTDLWHWMADFHDNDGRGQRAAITVKYRSSDGTKTNAAFRLDDCVPVKLRAPALNAMSSDVVAIEELTVAYQRLELVDPAQLGETRSDGGAPRE